MSFNALIVGVGGQGSLLASRIMGEIFLNRGLDVKISEVHGMAQRGGSVVTYVRAGKKVASPLVPLKEADVIISFEELEALRYIDYLKDGGLIIVNKQKIPPITVLSGAFSYPEDILEQLSQKNIKLVSVDALTEAVKIGNQKAVNVILIGLWAELTGISFEETKKALESHVKPQFLDVNLKAIEQGVKLSKAV